MAGSNDQCDDASRHQEFMVQAVTQNIMRVLDQRLEPLLSRMDRIDGGGSQSAQSERHDVNDVEHTPRAHTPRPGRVPQVDDNISNIKVAIPSFQGRSDPDAYMAWELKVEHVFECYNYSEQKKVRLAALEFIDYALLWWDQLLLSRRRTGEGQVTTWAEMKCIMRKMFVPSHYHREMLQKLQTLKQGAGVSRTILRRWRWP